MQTGRALAKDFRLLAGYMHWRDGALSAEVARGEWWLVAASRDYLLSLVRGGVPKQAALPPTPHAS